MNSANEKLRPVYAFKIMRDGKTLKTVAEINLVIARQKATAIAAGYAAHFKDDRVTVCGLNGITLSDRR